MKQLSPYLTIPGRCEEALNFYKECLGGEIISMETFAESKSQMKIPEEYKSKIIHSEFKAEEIYFMASDGRPGYSEEEARSNIALSINFSDEDEQEKVFNALSQGGKISMPLQNTFYSRKFGMFEDKFGIQWMLHFGSLPKK